MNVFYTPTAANDVTGRGNDFWGVAIMRPNVVADTTGSSGPTRVDNYFNKAAFAIPPAGSPFGNVGRNAFRAPAFSQWDLAVNKNFRIPVREGLNLQFRSEFFNVLNHTNLGFPTADITSSAFGTIRTTYPPRQIQFALKLTY